MHGRTALLSNWVPLGKVLTLSIPQCLHLSCRVVITVFTLRIIISTIWVNISYMLKTVSGRTSALNKSLLLEFLNTYYNSPTLRGEEFWSEGDGRWLGGRWGERQGRLRSPHVRKGGNQEPGILKNNIRTSERREKRGEGFQKLTHFTRIYGLLILGPGKKTETLFAGSSPVWPSLPRTTWGSVSGYLIMIYHNVSMRKMPLKCLPSDLSTHPLEKRGLRVI